MIKMRRLRVKRQRQDWRSIQAQDERTVDSDLSLSSCLEWIHQLQALPISHQGKQEKDSPSRLSKTLCPLASGLQKTLSAVLVQKRGFKEAKGLKGQWQHLLHLPEPSQRRLAGASGVLQPSPVTPWWKPNYCSGPSPAGSVCSSRAAQPFPKPPLTHTDLLRRRGSASHLLVTSALSPRFCSPASVLLDTELICS